MSAKHLACVGQSKMNKASRKGSGSRAVAAVFLEDVLGRKAKAASPCLMLIC